MWITLTTDSFQKKLSAAEWASLTNAQLPDGTTSDEVIDEEIASTTRLVVGYVGGNKENVIGPESTIPDELKDAALAILRHKVFTRIPGLRKLLDEGRVREYEDALRQLSDVSSGRLRVTAPATAGTEQPGAQTIAVVHRPTRINSRSQWSGTL